MWNNRNYCLLVTCCSPRANQWKYRNKQLFFPDYLSLHVVSSTPSASFLHITWVFMIFFFWSSGESSRTHQLLTEWRKWWGVNSANYATWNLKTQTSLSHCVFWCSQFFEIRRNIFSSPRKQWPAPSPFSPLPIFIISPVHWQLQVKRMLLVVCYLPRWDMSQFFLSFHHEFHLISFLQVQLKINSQVCKCLGGSSFLAVCDCFHNAFMLRPP